MAASKRPDTVGYAIEEAEGVYEWGDGDLVWREPGGDQNLHVEVAVRDATDGRFVPALTVTAALVDADGDEIGPHELPLLWHPMLYHYRTNITVPADGTYELSCARRSPNIHAPR